jgi:molybdopterin-guanine dinucleotide biosynthesis protein B
MQFVGYSNSGKTTLLTKLIPMLQEEGFHVGVIKHDGGHELELDQPGKDSWRFREAGASLVAVASRSQTAFFEQRPLPLSRLVERMGKAGADLVLVEGFKQEAYPKLVFIRGEHDRELLSSLSHVAGAICWGEEECPALPCFSIDDVRGIAGFVKVAASSEPLEKQG